MSTRVPDGIYMGWWSWHKADAHVRQRTTRVVFIPWDGAEGQEWLDKTAQWNLVTNNRFHVVQYDPSIQQQPLLAAINDDPQAVVYIRGHGSVGAPYIQVRISEDEATNLPITIACQRLIDSGLDPRFPGVIKFYSCYSGTKPTPEALANSRASAESNNERFARWLAANAITQEQYERGVMVPALDKAMGRQGADYFREKGFKSCIFYGYLGPVGSEYEQDATDEWHRHVSLKALESRPSELLGLSKTRPSKARIRV
ncbi:Hypothetical protein A7982_04659 [Minicystis rosea]|nr:Hypothetical protein A7982_04659 [Minicystis rosea]